MARRNCKALDWGRQAGLRHHLQVHLGVPGDLQRVVHDVDRDPATDQLGILLGYPAALRHQGLPEDRGRRDYLVVLRFHLVLSSPATDLGRTPDLAFGSPAEVALRDAEVPLRDRPASMMAGTMPAS